MSFLDICFFPVEGFELVILGFWAECTTTVLTGQAIIVCCNGFFGSRYVDCCYAIGHFDECHGASGFSLSIYEKYLRIKKIKNWFFLKCLHHKF
jgi:hypothetical protein